MYQIQNPGPPIFHELEHGCGQDRFLTTSIIRCKYVLLYYKNVMELGCCRKGIYEVRLVQVSVKNKN